MQEYQEELKIIRNYPDYPYFIAFGMKWSVNPMRIVRSEYHNATITGSSDPREPYVMVSSDEDYFQGFPPSEKILEALKKNPRF